MARFKFSLKSLAPPHDPTRVWVLARAHSWLESFDMGMDQKNCASQEEILIRGKELHINMILYPTYPEDQSDPVTSDIQ